jgi:hypothetical protein
MLHRTQNNKCTIEKITYNKVTAALFWRRLPGKIGTHPIPLPIGFLVFRNFYLARITTKAHRYWNTARKRLVDVRTTGRPAIATVQIIQF